MLLAASHGRGGSGFSRCLQGIVGEEGRGRLVLGPLETQLWEEDSTGQIMPSRYTALVLPQHWIGYSDAGWSA